MGKIFQIIMKFRVKLSIFASDFIPSALCSLLQPQNAFPKNLKPKKDAFLNMEYWRLVI